jgi:DNA-binding XRE family transcriptional regulator
MVERLTMGQLISFYRRRAGLSRGELARRAGISRRTLIMLEDDKQPSPKLGTLRSLADILHVHVKELIPDSKPATAGALAS